jgi:hypothetical protein
MKFSPDDQLLNLRTKKFNFGQYSACRCLPI